MRWISRAFSALPLFVSTNNAPTLEDREALINRLEQQARLLEDRFAEIRSMTSALDPLYYIRLNSHHHVGRLLKDIQIMCIINIASLCLGSQEAIVTRLVQQ
jgi:hypothetical protein